MDVDDTQPRRRHDWIDAARAVSILLVVLLHVTAELRLLGASSPAAEWISTTAQTLRMPVFFFVSGLLATKWMTASWGSLLRSKLLLLVWVYVVWQPVVFGYKVLEMLVLPNAPENSLATQVMKLVLSPVRPNGELWFLWALALFFVLARLLQPVHRVVVVVVAGAVSWAWLGWGFDLAQSVLPTVVARALEPGWSGLIANFVFFVAGARYSRSVVAAVGSWKVWLGILLFVGWVGASVLAQMLDVVDLVSLPLRVLGIAGGLGIAVLLARLAPIVGIGRATLPIYVAHVFVIVVTVIGLYLLGAAPLMASFPLPTTIILLVWTVLVTRVLHEFARRSPTTAWLYEPPRWLHARLLGPRPAPARPVPEPEV